jgi:hypothetical protein
MKMPIKIYEDCSFLKLIPFSPQLYIESFKTLLGKQVHSISDLYWLNLSPHVDYKFYNFKIPLSPCLFALHSIQIHLFISHERPNQMKGHSRVGGNYRSIWKGQKYTHQYSAPAVSSRAASSSFSGFSGADANGQVASSKNKLGDARAIGVRASIIKFSANPAVCGGGEMI